MAIPNVSVTVSNYVPAPVTQERASDPGLYVFGVRGTRYRKNRGEVNSSAVDVLTRFSEEIDSTESMTTEVHFKRGVVHLMEGRIQAAISDFTAAIHLGDNCAAAYANRGTALNMIDRFEQAIEDFNIALIIDPRMEEAFFGRGAAHMQIQRCEQAVLDFTACIKLSSCKHEYYLERALALYQLDCYSESEADIDAALKIKPDSVEATFCKGLLKATKSDFVASINYLTRTIELDEKYVPAYLVRSSIYKMLNMDNWIEDCKRANELDCTLRFG